MYCKTFGLQLVTAIFCSPSYICLLVNMALTLICYPVRLIYNSDTFAWGGKKIKMTSKITLKIACMLTKKNEKVERKSLLQIVS